MNGDVSIDSSEEEAPDRRGEGGGDSAQLEEENIGAVLPVENVEVQKTVDEDDAPQKVGYGKTADEVVGRPAAEGAGLQDDAEHHQVLQHREGTQSQRQHGHRQLLAGSQDHETLHVHKVLPTLDVVGLISERAPVAEEIGSVGGENGDILEDELPVCRYFVWEGVAAEGRHGFLHAQAALKVYIADGVVVVGVVGAQIL